MDENTRNIMRHWTLAQPVVSAFVLSIVRDFSERDDLLQDIAITVLEQSARYDSSRPFLPWALGIAQNHVRQFLRRQRQERRAFGEEMQELLQTAFRESAEGFSEKLNHLKDCLGRLEEREQLLCDLRYAEDLKPAAVAQRLGMSANAVSKALQRIRDQLRACIHHKSSMKAGS